MTVSTTSNKITYPGNGSTTSFSFPFPGVAVANILAFITDSLGNVTQLSPSLYTVTLNAPVSPNPTSVGGTVTYPLSGSPLPLGSSITILRSLALTQSVSLSNQSIIYPPVVEQALDYATMLDQQDTELAARAFQVGPTDPVPVVVPSVAQRSNQSAIWDSSGNLTAGLAAGAAPISVAMQPVVNSATLQLARLNMGISPNPVLITTNYTVTPNDDRTSFLLNGTPFTFTVPAPGGFPSNFAIFIENNGSRGINIAMSGFSSFYLYPSLSMIIYKSPTGAWTFTVPPRWYNIGGATVFVDPVNGLDSNDGLASGAGGAFQSINRAVSFIQVQADGAFIIQLANGTHTITSTVSIAAPTLGNSNGVVIVGNNATPGSCIITSNLNSAVLFSVTNNGILNISGFQINGPNNCTGFGADSGGVINLNNNFVCGTFGASGSFMVASDNGTINIASSYHIAGGGTMVVHMYAFNGGVIKYNPTTVTIDGPMTDSFFMIAQFGGVIASTGTPSFVNPGNVTGKRYSADSNGVITVGGGGALPPGTIGGTTSTGGQFI